MVDICLLGNSSNLTVKFVEVEEIHPEFPEPQNFVNKILEVEENPNQRLGFSELSKICKIFECPNTCVRRPQNRRFWRLKEIENFLNLKNQRFLEVLKWTSLKKK